MFEKQMYYQGMTSFRVMFDVFHEAFEYDDFISSHEKGAIDLYQNYKGVEGLAANTGDEYPEYALLTRRDITEAEYYDYLYMLYEYAEITKIKDYVCHYCIRKRGIISYGILIGVVTRTDEVVMCYNELF